LVRIAEAVVAINTAMTLQRKVVVNAPVNRTIGVNGPSVFSERVDTSFVLVVVIF
jgi:hypothetical protein